jgi:heat shock protein HslJ
MQRSSIFMAAFLLLAGCASGQDMAGPSESSPLAGSDWKLVALDGEPVAKDARASLTFASPTSVNGNGGCNNFVGGVTLSGDSVTFGNLAATRMACMGDAMTLETRYFEALSQARSYQQEGGKLILKGPNGGVLAQFEKIS